jgi:hypothetical protein
MAELKLIADSGGGTIALKAPATTTSNAAITLKLPVADGSANQLLKTDGSGNLGWATDSATDSTKMPLAGGTFTGDVTFTGASYNSIWDKSANALYINDNAAIKVGTGGDFTINHTGSHTYLSQNGTGDLYIRQYGASNSILFNGANSEQLAKFTHNGAVELYYDNSKKFETTSTGAKIDGYLGINEASPDAGIHLTAANDRACIRLENTYDTPDNVWELQPGIGGVSNTGFCIRDITDSANRLVIDGAGNVGIGENSPGQKLSVGGKIEARSGNWFIARSGDNSDYSYIKNPETSGSAIGFYTSGEKARIDSSGKVYVNRTTTLDSNYVNFSATKALSAGIPQNQINIGDAAAYNTTDNGGAIGFSAIYSSGGAYTTMASIEGVKTNNTDGNYNGDMVFKTRSHNGNNVTRMRLTDAGLCFGTDTAAVNALSDYEEGTFLPTAGGWSAAGTTTYTAREGYYIKIGQQVTVWLEVTWSDITNGSGVQAIGGFPFAHTGTAYSGVCWTHTENLGDDVISGKFGDGYGSGVLLYKPASGSEGYVAVDSNGGTVRLTCTYVSNT